MRKFHRLRGPRKAFIKGLAHNLIMKGRMETTVARAKEVRPLVEHLVSIAKKQRLAAFRLLLVKLPKPAAQKLYYDIVPKFQNRTSGFLRIIKSGKVRKRDAAPLAVIEFLS